ncbi:dynein assembly factor 1, axonemal homolog isoform X1 [Drosophila subobscura]|uniref:dynein assembly factor 1, axonemal homolog isoform X1 n=1 Tax=Drosophila subobscura TaxID=7241 RepID=UPI00155A8C5E|nr:dynein assembly factor 1, axonemal homolog isoform X1 [Drosophila subobscura]
MCEAGRGRRHEEVTGLNRITEAGLREICKRDKLYQTPRLNDVLYLHFQGYQCIENLDEYTELKTLWLESNAISEIQNLTKLTKLKCLYLQNNLITKIENLECNRDLDTLNVSQNHIRKIENIGTEILPVLNTLNITSNYLTDSASLAYLVECKTLSVLDLANNRIDDILIVKIFEQMPNLKVLVLQGNPVVSRLPQYRKTLILACKELTYLDSRPVFPRDRACAEAWKRDGYEGERKENQRWIRAERRKTRESVNCTIRMRNSHLKPEDQVALLNSSDSEEEQKGIANAEKTRKRAEMEYGSVDAMWDEVSGESQASEHSSTSSASAEDNESVGSQQDHIAERISNRRVKPLEGRPKVLYDEAVTGDVESIEKLVKNTEEKEQNNLDSSELKQQPEGKRNLIEEMDGNTNATLDNQKAESVEPESIDKPFNEALKENNVQESKGKRVLIEEIDKNYPIKELKLQPVGGKEHYVSKEEIMATGLKEKPVQSKEMSEAIMESCESVAHCQSNSAVESKLLQTNSAAEPSLLQSDTDSKPALPQSDTTSKPPLLQSDSDSELDNSADLEQTCQALLHVAEGNNDGEEPTPKEVKSKLIDEMYHSFGSEIFDELSLPLDQLLNESNTQYELSAKVCCEEETPATARNLYKEFVDEFSLPPKSKEQLEWEQECADASEKCAHDLAEMGSHLDEDLQELLDQAENICDNIPEQTESSDESDEELNVAALEAKSALLSAQFQERRQRLKEAMEERKQLQEKQDAAKAELASLSQRYSLFAKVMDDATDNVPKRVFGAGSDTPSQDWDKEERMRQLPLTSMEDAIKEQRKPSANAEDDDDDILTRPVTEQTSAEAAEEICDRLNRKLAGEEETLRQLLAELENENETFYSFDTEINYERSFSSEDAQLEMDCAALLNDLISDVIYKDITEMGPDSYPLGPFESDDENTYSEEPKLEKLVPPHLENPAGGKSLRECVDTFKEFLANKSNDNARPVSSTHLEKIRAAKALLLSKSLGDFSKDTPESLDAQLAKDEENRKRHAAASAGHCYAKREKYDDTLEVVDNRLMVVKKDTGELEELPPPPELVSDSEEEEDDDDAYDTADDETNQSIPRTPWNTPYEPKPRKSAEHLVDEAMKRCLAEQLEEFPDDTKENESLEEEFFSPQAKQTFGNLDLEFFEKLDLDKVTTANNAEAATECMRSYNELKACMKSGATELQLTSEENEMLEEMLSTNEDLEARAKSSDPELERENELLNKMMQRMKEDEEQARELQKQEEAALLQRRQEEDSKPIQLSLGAGSTLFQRWNPMSIEQEDDGANGEEGAAQGEGFPKEKEESAQAAKTARQVEDVPPADGQIPEGAQRVPQATERYPQRVSMPPVIGYEDIDEDGAPSDVTTDYSSDEELAVVEPPKIPTEMLKAYYYEGFEEDMRMVRENEVKARRGLRKIIQKEKQLLQHNELEMEAQQEKLPQVKSETETLDKPLVETAKDKWAKIASRLNEFLDPEAMAQLQSHEYGESDSEEDDDIMEDVAGLDNFDEDSETHLGGAVGGTSEEEKAAITEPKIGLETSPKDYSDVSELLEQMSRLEIAPEETFGIGDSEKKKPITEYQIAIPDDSNISDGPTEKLLKESDNEKDINAIGTQENTAETAESTTNLTNKKTTTKFVNLDNFSDTEPSESRVDSKATEATENSNQATLKTEQMEFQVDVLSDDGDVVKEVTVEAQVTYQ